MNKVTPKQAIHIEQILKWNGPLIFLFLLTGFTFSVLSSLDCNLINIEIGFDPANSLISQTDFGVGLWTFESFSKPGECYFYDVATLTSIVYYDNYYESYMFSSPDSSIVLSRILALSGTCIALIATIVVCVSIIQLHGSSTKKPKIPTKIFVLVLTLVAMCLEFAKIALFLQINLCTQSVWLKNTTDSIDHYLKAESCFFGRGSFSSIFSVFSYFITAIFIFVETIISFSKGKRGNKEPNEMTENEELVLPTILPQMDDVESVHSTDLSSMGEGY